MLHTYSETSAMCLCLSLTQSMSSSFRIACFSKPSLDLYLIFKKKKQKTMYSWKYTSYIEKAFLADKDI